MPMEACQILWQAWAATTRILLFKNPKTERKKMKILIVEDDPRNRRLLCDFLKTTHPDASIIPADNGELALEFIRTFEGQFDLVIANVGMPIMDGVKLTEKIREKHPYIKILLTSANPEPEEHKANAFLGYPVSLSQFKLAVNNLLGKP